MRAVIVEPHAQGLRVSLTARQHHLGARHPAADLGQAQRVVGYSRRVDGVGDVQLRLIRHGAGGFTERLFEWLDRVWGFGVSH